MKFTFSKKILLGVVRSFFYVVSFCLILYSLLVLTIPLFSALRNFLPNWTGLYVLAILLICFCILFIKFSRLNKACEYMFGVDREEVSTKKRLGVNFKQYEYKEIQKDNRLFIRRTLCWFAGLILICVIVPLAISSYYSAKVKARLKVLGTKGIPTSIKDFHRGIPEDKNAYPLLDNAAEDFGKVWDEIENTEIINSKLFRQTWTRKKGKDIDKVLDLSSPELNKIVKILDKYEFWEPVNYLEGSKDPVMCSIPKFANNIMINQLLCVNALSQAKKNRIDGAWNFIRKDIKFLKLIGQQPGLIGAMIAVAIQQGISETVLRIISLNPEAIIPEVLEKELSEIRESNMVSGAFRFESAHMTDIFSYLRERGGILIKYTGYFEVTHIEIINYFAGMVEDLESGQPYKKIHDDSFVNEDRIGDYPIWPFVLAKIAVPKYASLCAKEYKTDTYTQLALLVNKLKIFEKRTGRYPNSFAELVRGGYVKAVDIEDKFSGQKLIYKKSQDHLLLYSVGANLKDDCGDFSDDDEKGVQKDIGIRIDLRKSKR